MRILTTFVAMSLVAVPLYAQLDLTRVEEVRYVSQHDPGWIVLERDREIRVRWAVPGSLTFEDVTKWRPGKALSIAFSPADGPILLDLDTGRSIPIVGGLEKHPIDGIIERCLTTELSTRGMAGCYERGLRLWDGEMNRLYALLVKALSPAQRSAVENAQTAWLKYRDTQSAAIGAVYTQGTISAISRADEVMGLTRSQAQLLAHLASVF